MFTNVTASGTIALWVLAVLLPVQLYIGWKVSKKSSLSAEHYFISGKELGFVLVFFADFATVFGVGNFIGYSGKGYEIGLGQMWMVFGEQGSKIAFALLLAGIAGRYAYTTLSEFMEQQLFHDKFFRALSSIALALPMICWTGAQAIGIGSLLAVVMGIDPTTGIWVAALVAIMYTVMGGMWAIAWTDLLQGLIRIVVGLVFFAVIYINMDGVGGLQTKVMEMKPALWTFGSQGFLASLALLLAPVAGMFTYQAYWQRCFSAKDAKTAKHAYLWTGILAVIMCSLSVGVGMAAYTINPNLPRPDMAFPWLLNNYLHPVMSGLLIVAIIGADMTVSAGLLNSGVTLVMMDIVKPYFCKDATGPQLVQMSRWLTLVAGVGVVGVAFVFPTVIAAGLWGYQICGGGLFMPLVIGLMWKDKSGHTFVTKNAAIASLILGGGTAAIVQYVPSLMKIFGGGIIPGLLLSFVLTVGISLLERSKVVSSSQKATSL